MYVWYVHVCSVVSLFKTVDFSLPAALFMGFPSQEYWSGLPFPPPTNLPNPGIKPAFPALAGRFFTSEPLVP